MAPGGTEEACFDRLRQEARVSPVPVLETVASAPPPSPARARASTRPAAASRAAQRPAASRPGT